MNYSNNSKGIYDIHIITLANLWIKNPSLKDKLAW